MINKPDIFVSYAHVNNQAPESRIDAFILSLERKVNEEVGRISAHRFWKDNRLEGNQVFSNALEQKLKQATCLLAFLSKGYLASEWCLKELTVFQQHNQAYPERLFYVELDAIPQDKKPDVLQQALGYRFWYRDDLSKETFALDADSSDYKKELSLLAKQLAQQLEQKMALETLVEKAQQARRNHAYDKALELWQSVHDDYSQHPTALQEIAALKQQQAEAQQAGELMMQLFQRMAEIKPVFSDVAEILREPDARPEASIIMSQTQLFLHHQLPAEHYVSLCQTLLKPNPNAETPDTKPEITLSYQRLAKNIYEGNTVLFLGSNVAGEYGEKQQSEQDLAQQLAKDVGYDDDKPFNGSLSAITPSYQKRPGYGRQALLQQLRQSLADNYQALEFYPLLARIDKPLLLISSAYDDLLETAFREQGKPFVLLSSVVDNHAPYDVGHLLIHYSDREKAEEPQAEEALSSFEPLEQQYSLIYKMRGICEAECRTRNHHPLHKEALLLAEQHYFTFARYASKIIPKYLIRSFHDRDFMFVGFNPQSWEERLLVDTLLSKRNNHSSPCYTAGTSNDPVEAEYWEAQGVKQYDIALKDLDIALKRQLP